MVRRNSFRSRRSGKHPANEVMKPIRLCCGFFAIIAAWEPYGGHGDVIRRSPHRDDGKWGGSTCKGKTIYLHVFKWDGDQLRLPALKSKILSCKVMDGFFGRGVKISQAADAVTFILPAPKQDKIDTVSELRLNDPAADEFTGGKPIAVETGK